MRAYRIWKVENLHSEVHDGPMNCLKVKRYIVRCLFFKIMLDIIKVSQPNSMVYKYLTNNLFV